MVMDCKNGDEETGEEERKDDDEEEEVDIGGGVDVDAVENEGRSSLLPPLVVLNVCWVLWIKAANWASSRTW